MLETLLQNEYRYKEAGMRLVERGRQAPTKFGVEMFFVLLQEKAKEISLLSKLFTTLPPPPPPPPPTRS